MTLTYESDLALQQTNHHAKYLGHGSFRWRVMVRTHTQRHRNTYRADRSHYPGH